MKAIILARVSTEEQKEAGNSLPAQVERLKSYCQCKGFQAVQTFSFDESAYKTKRDEFDKILDFLKSNKEKIAVCFDKVDRFSRNVFDKRVSTLYELAMKGEIELHFASDNLVITPDISATEKFHFGMNLGLAKYFSDAISDNVKRAYETKKRNGEWTGRAPIGYKNIGEIKGNKDVILDPKKAHLIRKMFELYATGNHSTLTLRIEMSKEGLNSSVGKPLALSMVSHILNNPFYYGEMLSRGKLYPHKYQPIISKQIFDKCQQIRKSWNKKPFKYASKPYIFRGLIRCARCGCSMSPETAKGKYIFYSCTNAKKDICSKKVYIPERDLLKPVYGVLQAFESMPQTKIDEIVEGLRKSNENKDLYHKEALKSLRQEYDTLQNRLSRLADLLLDQSITKDFYDEKLKEMKEKQYDINIQIEDHTRADENYYITASTVLNLAKNALRLFESSEVLEKRAMLNFLLQNCVASGKKLEFDLRSPFDHILTFANQPTGLREQGSNLRPIA